MIIRTKEDFYKAKKNLPEIITFDGELGRELIKAIKANNAANTVKKGSRILGGLAIAGGVLAAPFTGGLSLGATVTGVAMVDATAALSTFAIALICATIVASLVITKDEVMELLNHYDFKIQAGDNTIEGKRKD